MKKVFLFAVSAVMMAACNCNPGNSSRCSGDACRGNNGENCREECVENRNCNADCAERQNCDNACADSCRNGDVRHRSDCVRNSDCSSDNGRCSDRAQRCRSHHDCRANRCR